ncbi:MAG: winged-helix domain-containing protein [Aggregatilineales bacterium]
MQETRQHILEILRETTQATVDEIVDELRQRRGDNITAVTVRHHLNILQKSDLITLPKLLHRSSPGRPQHVYELTENAQEHFPNNYQRLAQGLLEQLSAHLPHEGVNVILEGVADDMAQEANITDCPFDERLDKVVNYLNQHGYNATWEKSDQGYILSTHNCPYHEIAQANNRLCEMDMRLISSMLGFVPRLLSRVSDGDMTCAYLIPAVTS